MFSVYLSKRLFEKSLGANKYILHSYTHIIYIYSSLCHRYSIKYFVKEYKFRPPYNYNTTLDPGRY